MILTYPILSSLLPTSSAALYQPWVALSGGTDIAQQTISAWIFHDQHETLKRLCATSQDQRTGREESHRRQW